MPVSRVPVVHKFGIISHSQRLELQERLLKQTYLQSIDTGKPPVSTTYRNKLEVTEDFVASYNNAATLDEQESLQVTAGKMLQRIKRKSGLQTGGVGQHVDLPLAWTELSQLAQCKGVIQEECLDVLITSLDQAPLHRAHLPALFYLAEVMLYWLRTDAIDQPFLRTLELKLLRMGQLIFMRLFYHHMTGHLQEHKERKVRLFTYLDGFAESQEAYNPYPNALLCLRYITTVGLIIMGDSPTGVTEAVEVINTKGTSNQSQDGSSDLPRDTSSQSTGETPHKVKLSSGKGSDMFHTVSAKYEGGSGSSRSGVLSSSVHDLSPTLWHSLDVWRCVRSQAGGLHLALHSLAKCGAALGTENWVDAVCSMHVLADAAKANLEALRGMQNLARGLKPKSTAPSTAQPPCINKGSLGWRDVAEERESEQSNKTLSDLVDHSTKVLSDIFETVEDVSSGHCLTNQDKFDVASENPSSQSCDTLHSQPSRTTSDSAHHQVTPNPGPGKIHSTDAGSRLSSGRHSVATYANTMGAGLIGLHSWRWEVADTFADMLADICLHGNTSAIKKMALVGCNKDVSDLHRYVTPLSPMRSAGLLDLVFFRALNEPGDGGCSDWSWRVRYSAIQGLVKVGRCCAGDQTKDGLHTVAWNTLIRAHSIERDVRVLEALKVGQVGASIEKLLSQHMTVQPSAIGAKIAAGLSSLYLPALPLPVDVPTLRKMQQASNRTRGQDGSQEPQHPRRKLRTTLREEVMLSTAVYEPPVSYRARTSLDLKRIVEDQWRKELQRDIDEQEQDRQTELAANQKKDEEHQCHLQEQRNMKQDERSEHAASSKASSVHTA